MVFLVLDWPYRRLAYFRQVGRDTAKWQLSEPGQGRVLPFMPRVPRLTKIRCDRPRQNKKNHRGRDLLTPVTRQDILLLSIRRVIEMLKIS